MMDCKGHRFGQDFILTGARGCRAYPLGGRNLEKEMATHGVAVAHASGMATVDPIGWHWPGSVWFYLRANTASFHINQ